MIKDNKTHFSFKDFRNNYDNIVREDQERVAKEIAIEKYKKAKELAEQEENSRDDSIKQNSQSDELSYYKSISPKQYYDQTSDPTAFYDAIAPNPLSPEYKNWAKRQSKRNADNKNWLNPAAAVANQAANQYFAYKKQQQDDINSKKYENAFDRLNRRLFENSTFGKLNKKKALTDQEYQEVFNYRAINDPDYLRAAIDDLDSKTKLSKQQQEEDLAQLISHKPDDYLGQNIANASIGQYGVQGTFGMSNMALSAQGLAESAYGKSFASDFIIKTNQSQAQISSGQISRAHELQFMSDDVKEYLDLTRKYASNLFQIQQIQIGTNYGRDTNIDSGVRIAMNNDLNRLLKENQDIRAKLNSEKLRQSLNNLASWSAGGYAGQAAQYIDAMIDDDLGGIRRGLFGLGGNVDDLIRFMQSKSHDKNWLTSVNNKLDKIYNIVNNFNDITNRKIEGWKKDHETDIKDIEDWKNGNNFLKAHANVDDYYKAQEQILQNEQYSWKDPVKMAAFGWSGIAGGSNSSWWKSGISMASSIVGYTFGFGYLSKVKGITQLAAIATNFEAQKSAGSDENNIEASNKSSDYLKRSLINKDLYDDFIKEGLSQLTHNATFKDLQNLGDAEEVKQYITDAYLAGIWHSKNPEITKSHRDAVVGNNTLFYNDQPVNTADALIGSLATTARLEPIKELALGTKIKAIGRLGRMKFAKTAAGLRYAGFKEGIHGAAKKALENEAAKTIGKGLVKAGDGLLIAGRIATIPVKYPYKLGESAAKWIGKEAQIARRFNRIREFATSVPSAYLKAATVGKKLANLTGRTAIDTASEMLQEGVQGFNAQYSKDDTYGYDQSYNTGMANRVFDDLITGGKAAWYWLNQNDPAYYTDADVVPSMNATPLLTLFGPNTISIFTQANQVKQDFKAINAIQHNLDVMKRTTDAELIQGEELAKLAMSENKDTTLKRFQDFKRIVGKHSEYSNKENAYRRLNHESLLEEDEDAIPEELIDEQYKKYEDIYSLAHSEQAQVMAKRAGINLHSWFQTHSNKKKYAKLVSLLNYRLNSRNESYEDLRDTDQKIQEMFNGYIQPDESYYEDDVDQNHNQNADEQNAKALASLYAMYQLHEDYSKLEEQTGKEHSLSNHFKAQTQALSKALKNHGIDVSNKEDVLKVLDETNLGNKLFEMLSPALQKQGFDISNLSIKELFDGQMADDYNDVHLSNDDRFGGIASIYRQRHMQEYNALLQQHLLNDLERNPQHQIDKYNAKLQTDHNIEAILEEDYVNSIRKYEDAAVREIKENDVFVGNDGHWYITHAKKLKNGEIEWTKRRYHPNTGKIDSKDETFSRTEYNDSLTEREAAYKRKQQQKEQQNTSIQQDKSNNKPYVKPESTIQNDTEGTTPIPEEQQQEEQQQEEQQQGEQQQPDNSQKKKYTAPTTQNFTGKYIIYTDILGEESVGKIVKVNYDGSTVVENMDGKTYELDPFEAQTAQFMDKPDEKYMPKYKIGDTVLYNGRRYKIDIIRGDNETGFVYDLSHRDKTGIEAVSALEDQLQLYNKKEYQTPTTIVQIKEGRVQPNEKQNHVLDILDQKQKEDQKLVAIDKSGNKITTAFNYFIKVGNRFMSFIRVHGIIGSQMNKPANLQLIKNETVKRLRNAVDIKKEIIDIQNEFNKKLEEDYGKDSFEYQRYHIDLSMYTKSQMLSKNEVYNTIQAISEIVSNEIPGPAVIAGQIVDEICRVFFAGEELVNKPEYKMTDAIFKDTVNRLSAIQFEFNQRGWVVDTTPYTWYFTAPNGQRVAGETDLIAIDREGNIHVLDFKTTRSKTRFTEVHQFKSKNPITGEEVWQTIPEGQEAPEGVKPEDIRKTYPFFTEHDSRYNRNYAQQYARQLHMYRLMIQEQTGAKVTSLEIIPFYVDYDTVGNNVSHMSTVQIQEIVNLNGTLVEDEFKNLDNYLSSKSNDKDRIDNIKSNYDKIVEHINTLKNALISDYITEDTKYSIEQLLEDIKTAKDYLTVTDNNQFDKIDSILDDIYSQIKFIEDTLSKEEEQYNRDHDHLDQKDDEQLDSNWEDEPLEVVPDSAKQHWYQFNNLHSTIDFLKTIPNYLKSIVKSDFIKNSEFRITRNGDGSFSVSISYSPNNNKIIKFAKQIQIRIGNETGSNADVQTNAGDLSIMARNLIRQYKSLFNSLKEGEYIVAKNVQRTNGQLVYSENDHSLMDTPFIQNDKQLAVLLNGEDSLIGVVGKNGEIFEVEDSNRSVLGNTYKFDEHGKPLPKGYTPVPGNELAQNEHMPAGSVVFLYKFKYDEDPVDAPMRSVTISLRGKRFEQNDIDLIVSCLQQMAASQDKDTDTLFQGVRLYSGNKEISNESSRITCQQILKTITRFGKQAQFAGHEFIFQYTQAPNAKNQNHNLITITDMTQDPVIDPETQLMSRPTIDLDISNENDLSKLKEILSLVDMHINQAGIMRSKLNDNTSLLGMMCMPFEDTDQYVTKIKFGDFEITREDYESGLDGIGWMIKHGYARTNAESIQNPLISITDLEKTSKEAEQKKVEEEKKPVSDGGQVGVDQETKEQKPVEHETKPEEQSTTTPKSTPKVETGSNFSENELDDAKDLGNLFGSGPISLDLATNRMANERISEEQQKYIEEETKRLVGNIPLIFVEHEIETLANGAKVAGMISTDTITLSKRAPQGAQYHEAFHRILELLVGEKRRQKIYKRYEEHFGKAFERSHGRKLTERDIAEGLAEMFRSFMNDRDHIHIKWNNFWKLKTIFGQIKQYIQALRNLGDRNFAMLFVMANSGWFRHVKPKQQNIERFVNNFNGQMYLTITGKRYYTDENDKRTSKRVTIDLSEFPQYGGMQMFEEALDHIVSTIIKGYNIDMTASNASRIATDLSSMQKLYHGNEKTEHSAFFRVLTGEYTKDPGGMTVQDAIQYYKTYYGTDEILQITAQAIKDVGKNDLNELRKQIIRLIANQESKRKPEDLNQSQKMFAQLFNENNWDIIEQKINRRMQVLGIDSQLDRLEKQLDDEKDATDDENSSYIGQEIAAHDDAFYTHDRSEDTTAAVRFILSTIPDERFATEEDVQAGRVKSITNSDGSRVMIPNHKGILGFTGYVPRNQVKNLLLSACYDCKSAEDLLSKLHKLAETDPIFYRLERKFSALLNNSIKKYDDGKCILIKKDGSIYLKDSYYQHNGEDGIYFTYADEDGKDSGNRISEYDYDVDTTSSEALATQIFNFVSSQKLDFMQVKFSQMVDENGQPIDGKYHSEIVSSDSGYAASVFPRQWFTQFRSGVSGVFYMNKNGNIKFVKNGEEETGRKILETARNTLGDIYKLYTGANGKRLVNGRGVDAVSTTDFIYIESQFIHSLNALGIDISKPALENYLRFYFKTDENNITIQKAFSFLITRATQDLSFKKFMEAVVYNKNGKTLCDILLGKNQDAINEALMSSKKEDLAGKNKEYASGINIYADNAFVKWCAQAVSRYNKSTAELMTNGPENTKNYTMAQRHTAYDMTEDINSGQYDDERGEFIGSSILKDSQKWNYCWSTRQIPGRTQQIGSLIMKYIANGGKSKLKLCTYNGARVEGDYNGGVKYTKTSEREDYVGKCQMLALGKIIFPTLSDKSTWFFLDGIKTPGIDYNNISNTQIGDLLHLTDINGTVHIKINPRDAQIKQIIEYAFCERNSIKREIERQDEKDNSILKILNKIERVKENRMRFGSLTKIVRIGEDGKLETLHLTGDKLPIYYLQKADEWFFGDHITDAQRAEMMALTLEEGFYENLSLAEHCGAIVNDNKDVKKLPRLYTYKNVSLDHKSIDKLQAKYMAELTPAGKNISIEDAAKAKSQAVLAYMWDTYLRGIISEEEVERLYTGSPTSYKWKYGIVNGVKRLIDRHSDQTKRLGGLGSTGERNRPFMVGIRSKYRCAEIEDQMVQSKQIDALRQLFPDAEIRQLYYEYKSKTIQDQDELDSLVDKIYGKNGQSEMSLDEIKKDFEDNGQGILYEAAKKRGEDEASVFGLDKEGNGQINVADGAAYITPKMAKNLLRQLGKYTKPVREAFEYLEGKKNVNILSDKQAFKTIYEAMLGAQKYSAYGYRPVGDIKIQYYNKFALFPLFKQMASGYTQQILQKMEDQHIDMLMMHSAVKIGSQSPAVLTEDILNNKESYDNFQFDTYDQDYKFIRRQLNTDPHEKKFAQMGTQMTKVALTSLIQNKEYTTSNGETIRGRDLLKHIMNEINNLSTSGMKELENEMFDENGDLNIEKFSRFLEEELESRDADENLIDGIQVTYDKDGKKHFKVNLEAMSSIDWIQSILVAKLNKKIVDINVKGNAFYQRSVWGMEGKPTILSDDKLSPTINDGNDLKMVNEDGSMDSVISIDFFMDILPENLKNNFDGARKWLIKNKVIGKDAKANTIASRIPTQAQSSIHALRFVDVLPVVRDTIVLPKEFTMITGSDFDIDKLYLARLSYRPYKIEVQKDGKNMLIDRVSTDFKTGDDRSRNNLLNYYMTILKDHGKDLGEDGIQTGASANISLRSIDADTSLVKNVLKKIETNKQEQEEYAYKFGNIAFQVKTRGSFVVGKFGIGPFALNNNNQILTQLYGVKFDAEHCPLLRELGCLDLSSLKDKQGNLKLSWLSGLINAHVDVAKDPYIQRLNINTFTYNTTNLLIRTGMGERTFMFLSQPIMKELASVYEMAGGNYMEDMSMSKAARQRFAVTNYILDNFKESVNTGNLKNIKNTLQKIGKDPNVEESISSFAKALFGIDENGNYAEEFEYIQDDGTSVMKKGCILEDIFKNKDVLHNSNKELSFDNLDNGMARYRINVKLLNDNGELTNTTVDLSPKQVQLYVAYINQAMSKYGQKLSDLVNSCKIDTKKQGKSYVEQCAFESKYNDVFDNNDELFEQDGIDRLKNESYIGTKTENSLSLYSRIINQISLQGTEQFKTIHNQLMEKFHSSEQNKDLSKKISRYMMTAIKKVFFDTELIPTLAKDRNMDDTEYAESLFFGNNTVQDQLLKIQNKIRNDKKGVFSTYGENGVITNPLLKALQADVYEERDGYSNPKFIKLENAVLDDSDNANAIERAWDDLYHDEEHYIEDGDNKITFKQFAENLFVYAFYTSGDTVGTSKFFKYAPNTIRIGSGYANYMSEVQSDFQYNLADFDVDSMYESICEDNWTDPQIVREFRTKRFGKFQASFLTQLSTSKTITILREKGKQVIIRKAKLNKTVNLMIACVKKDSKSGTKLSTIKPVTNDKTGLQEFPSYIKVRQRSFDKYDPDNYILYKLADTRPLNTANPSEGFYPIYKICMPNSARLRAGSYSYNYIKPYGTRNIMYDESTIQAVEQFFKGNHLTSDKPFVEDTLVDKFVDLINNSPVTFAESELISRLKEEFDYNQIDITTTKLRTLVEKYIDKDHLIKFSSDEKKSNSKTSTKKAINDKIINVHYGNNEHRELSNLAKRPFITKINGLGELKFKSVEGAFQATKLLYTKGDEYIKGKDENGNYILTNEGSKLLKTFQEASDNTGKDARKEGKSLKIDIDKWDDVADEFLEKYMKESFEQNEDAKKALLDTGSKKIVHENAKGIEQDGGRFSKILTQIRKELSKSKLESNEETLDEFKARAKNSEVNDYRLKDLSNIDNSKDFTDKIKQLYYNSIKRSPKDIYNEFKSKLEELENTSDFEKDKLQVLQYMQALINEYSKEEKPTSKEHESDDLLDDDFDADKGFNQKPIELTHKDAEKFGNTYHRPFTKNGIQYDNVIQANYCEAILNSSVVSEEDKISYTNELHNSSDYNIMRQIIQQVWSKYGKESVSITAEMMINNMKESFKQNPKILNALLSTGNSNIQRRGKEDAVTQCMSIARSELQDEELKQDKKSEFDEEASNHCRKK